MQLIDPLNEDHRCVILLAVLEHGANLPNETIEIEYNVLRRKTCEDCVLDLLVNFLREFLYFVIGTANQCDNVVENGIELSALEYLLSVALRDVEDGVAGRHRHLRVLVNLKALRDWRNHLIQELRDGLV